MALRTEEAIWLVAVHRGAIEQTKDTTYFLVEFFHIVFTFLYKFLIGQSKVITIIGIGSPHGQTIGPRTELEVESIGDCLVGIMTSTPITDYHTIVTPILFQNLIQQNAIMTVVLVFIKVVGAHNTPCASLGNGCFEGRQINLVESTLTDDNINLMTVLFVVV